ncbi:hypothetical protein [Listeria fleischmannii]|uniref:Phage tail tape measure protein, TP901 family n=1 Tax=Listeria fleischmannii FSL S10-1203 TaxID=1265822 RepID=W7DV07_9LIST|nr:hypothetical protein [Listeria fleischmannii]EUJ59559.1 phage tail tape measure protein, TP901 family [Listeria fleischmannii FSL S10-1203]
MKSTNDMIYKAMKERGTLTTDEQKRVNNASNALMAAEIQSLDISNKKKIILLKNLNSDMSKMSKMQALEAADNISQAMKKSTASFNKQKEALQENIEMGKLLGLDTSDYEVQLETLKTKNKETTLDMATKWYQFQKSAGTDTKFLKEALKQMGVSYDDVKKRANKVAHDIDSSNILIAKSSENATISASSANEKWNTMIWDEKTGTVSTDVKEKIQEASKSNEGWNNLKFILHHADLTSDATDMVRQALIENGKWNDLNFQDKQMLTTYPSAALTMSAINDIGEWDKLDPKQQNLIAQAKTSDELRKALNDLGLWDKLPIRTKQLLLRNDEIINKLRASESLIVEYNGRKANLKELLADNSDLSKKLKNGGDKIVTYNGQKISLKDLFANNRDLLNKLAKGKATIHDYNEIKAHRKDLNVYSNAETVKQAIDGAIASWEDMLNQRNKKVIEIAYKTSGRAPTGIQEVGYAKGTDFHKGGAALVNDAAGFNYRELITTPKGQAFIPQGRNVLLDLPRGSAVLRGDKTAKLLKAIPKFANGTRKAVSPIFANSTLMSVFASVLKKRGQSSSSKTGQKNDAELIEQLKESNRQQNKMIELLEALLVKDISIDAQALTKKSKSIPSERIHIKNELKR